MCVDEQPYMPSIDQAGSFHFQGIYTAQLVYIVYKHESQIGMVEESTLIRQNKGNKL